MCGIIGYIGNGDGINDVLDGLQKLEYRGYDSAGLAYLTAKEISTVKSVGHVAKLHKKVSEQSLPNDISICIGHTRWATHGAVNEKNSHPHLSNDKQIAVVHNGIIENYKDIIEFLYDQGYRMKTQTDTEVIPNLIQFYKSQNKTLVAAIQETIKHLKGSYAIVVISTAEPETLICAKHGMPLSIGKGKDFAYVTSDIPTALTKTNTIYVLENDELATIKNNHISFSKDGKKITKTLIKKSGNSDLISKGEFSTFMEKEINDIPSTFEKIITHYQTNKINKNIVQLIKNASTVHICACGTAYHAGKVLELLLEKECGIRAKSHIASEFRYNSPAILPNDVGIVISQSGETADTIAAMHLLHQNNIPTISFCNTDDSTIARGTTYYLPTLAGFEIAVASTKAYCAQTLLAAILVNAILPRYTKHDLSMLPMLARSVLGKTDEIKSVAKENIGIQRIFFIGKGLDAVTSLESALKVKEITYMQCEGYPAGELKHGTLSLVDTETLTIVFQTDETLAPKTANAAAEVRARGSRAWQVTTQDEFNYNLPSVSEHLSLLIPASPLSFTYAAIPAQLFALYLCLLKGYDPDKPRNLAKSVTVE